MDFEITPVYHKKGIKKAAKFTPVVSIITPFYNSFMYFNETVTSVLAQSFPWFEWIIVDDGSSDEKSLNCLKEVEKMDDRIRVFHKKNEGLAATRDFGAKQANKNTKYFLFLDDDDLIESNYIETLFFALETNEKASFAYTNIIGFGEKNYIWDKRFDIHSEAKENMLIATALIRKKDFFEVGGYGTKEKEINEDWIFWIKMFGKSKIPLRVNYYGFWYRRKVNGELKKSMDNIDKTKSIMQDYIKNIDYSINSIDFPCDNYNWDDVERVNYHFEPLSKMVNDKENILLIIPHIVMGGADKFNIDFLKGLDEKYNVIVVITNISDNVWLSKIKGYIDTYYILPSFLYRKYWPYFIDYLIKKYEIKLVFNTNSIYGYMSLPFIKSMNNDIKIIDYVHVEEWYNRNGGYSRDSSSVQSVIDKTLVCNNKTRDILTNYFKRDKNEVETVYIGVDEKKFTNDYTENELDEIKTKYNLPKDKKIISFICRIASQKRPFLFLEIVKKYLSIYNDSIFLVAGDGPFLDELKEKLDSSSVYFLGATDNTKEIYAISDCTLNCSIKEGVALTTYESLSMGVAVVSSDVGGQSEIIDKDTGVLISTSQKEEDVNNYEYDLQEIDDFVSALRDVLTSKKDYKTSCRKKILSYFTIDIMNKKMNNIISDTIKNKSKKKFENKDIALELLNQYFLESKDEYNYFINTYNSRYNTYNDGISFKERVSAALDRITIKLHIYHEIRLLRDIFLSICKIIYSVFKLPYIVVKRIVKKIIK